MDDATNMTTDKGGSVPSYPSAEAWERMSEGERAEFDRRYQDAVGRSRESTGSDNDDPQEPVSRVMA